MKMKTTGALQVALEYVTYGWRVLPIKPASKLPLIKAWQVNASSNPAQIEAWWTQWPTANVGVCLGEGSNLIDVECDSDEAEKQLVRLFGGSVPQTATYKGQRGKHRLFQWRADLPGGAVTHLGKIEVRTGNGGKGAQSVFPPSIHPSGIAYQWIVSPTECMPADLPDAILTALWNQAGDDLTPPAEWRSGEKSPAERAALYVDRIPAAAAGARNQQCYKVACVLLRDFALSESEAAPILAAYNARCTPALGDRELAHTIQSATKYGLGVRGSKLDGDRPRKPKVWEPTPAAPETEDGPNDGTVDMTEKARLLISQAKELTKQQHVKILFESIHAINDRLDRPLGPNELKAVFTYALTEEQKKRLNDRAADMLLNPPADAVESAAESVAGRRAAGVFKLIIVESDPPRYELHAPQFSKAAGKCVVLTAEQMNSASAIRVQALKQAEYPLPKVFDKEWSKPGGIYEAVVHTAEHRAAPADSKRAVVIAEMLLEAITRPQGAGKPQTIEDGGEPDPRGRPCLMPDGSIVCKFTPIWEPMRRSEDKVERMELSAVLQTVGAVYRGFRATGKVSRFVVLSRESVTLLRRICEAE
jgi:hypothetical protein